ncbi:acyltransferase [Halopseudomonas pachastrellae]|nr:acyltransferase [Halopseudomonas pachastrellae]
MAKQMKSTQTPDLLKLFGKFDPEVPLHYKINFIATHLSYALRGILTLGLSKGSSSFFFRYPRAKLLCKSRIRVGSKVRIGFNVVIDGLGKKGVTLGANTKIGDYSRLICSGTLSNIGSHIDIGENVGIGEFCRIGGSGGVTIGKNTIAGQYLSIHPENHIFSDKGKLIKDQGTIRSEIRIGQNCWIGAKVTILAGSEIGDSCVIAAGSVVSGKFPSHSVIGGVPAKLIKSY